MESETQREKSKDRLDALRRDSKTPKGEYMLAPDYNLAGQDIKGFIEAQPYEDMAEPRDYSLQNKRDAIPTRKDGESLSDYQRRLNTYSAALIGLAERMEKEMTLQRFGQLKNLTRYLFEEPEMDVSDDFRDLIRTFERQIEAYESQSPELKEKREIRERKEQLEKLARGIDL